MRSAYPPIKSYAKHSIDVDGGHTLFVEECGSPNGIPVLFVHGGPGAGLSRRDREFFNPEKYRIILFDQRGSGRSTPHASLEENTTQHLIADIEKIREHMKVDQWMLFGGSWGSTLSLLYAQALPERVSGLVLRGIFLCRQKDIQWFYQFGASEIFPDHWREFREHIPVSERSDFLQAYYRRLVGKNELEQMSAAKIWSAWEARCATLNPNSEVVSRFIKPHTALSLARIEAHYFVNQCFIAENQIIDQADRLAGIPGVIVHGRYDMVCPVEQAFTLYDAWPDASLEIIRDAGHASSEPGIVDALVKATDEFAQQLAS